MEMTEHNKLLPSASQLVSDSERGTIVGTVAGEMTDDIYLSSYWCKLEGAVKQLLSQESGSGGAVRLSYEQMYSCVYTCVCQQYSEQLYQDLRRVITSYLQERAIDLQSQMFDPTEYTKHFNNVLRQYSAALGGIVPIFTFMNRFYISKKLKMELKPELEKIFVQQLENHIYGVLECLQNAQGSPFSIHPSIVSEVVHGLYAFKPDLAALVPSLFARYIPNVLPPCIVDSLPEYIEETMQMQIDLLGYQEFNRDGPNDKKRSSDADGAIS